VKPSRIVGVLKSINADVVALQEVLSSSSDTAEANQAAFIAQELGMHYRLGQNRKIRDMVYGNVVFSRLPIVYSRNHDVSCNGRECRGCLRTDIQLAPAAIVHIFNVHLGTSLRERRQQAGFLLSPDILGHGELSGPRVLLGDFNDWELRLASRLKSSRLVSADIRAHSDRRGSYPSIFPVLHLDHIYYDSALHLDSVRLVRSRAARIASDHLPLCADLHLITPG
jgi:endonuclease/exonuclease/phosphatase family metal-dependent hydrolase